MARRDRALQWRRAIGVVVLVILPLTTVCRSASAQEAKKAQGGSVSSLSSDTSSARPDEPAAPQPGRADGTGKPSLGWERHPLYRFVISDVLDLSFTFTPEFNQTLTVQPDGRIALRGVAAVLAEGRTAEELEAEVRQAYSAVLHEPEVTVTLKEFEKPYFIASGEVTHPGKYELRSPTTVAEGVAIAGGLTLQSKHSQVIVFRHVSPGLVEARVVDIKRMLKDKDLNEDLTLKPGDFVVVPKSLVANVMRFMPATTMGMFLTNGHF